MARTWHTSPGPRAPNWWSRHWANPNFSGSLIGIVSVLVVMAVGVLIAVHTLHLTWADLDVSRFLHR